MGTALTIHLLAAIIWVGGMFFAHLALRPAVAAMPLPERVLLWHGVLNRFIPWVWAAVVVLPMSGYWMVFKEMGGPAQAGLHVHLMQGIGWLMISLFLYLVFWPYRAMRRMVREELYPEAGLYFLRIRTIMITNLTLGLLNSIIGNAGRYW